jgi:hypothetical protein
VDTDSVASQLARRRAARSRAMGQRLPHRAPARRRIDRTPVPRCAADDAPAHRTADDTRRTRSGDYGCGGGSAERDGEAPRATAGPCPGRTQRGGRGEAVGARLDDAATPRDVLQGRLPTGGAASQQAHPGGEVDPDQSFHSLRHTYASLCLAAGIRPIDIAALMGPRDARPH